MAKAAKYPALQEAFTSHLVETKGHVERLGEVFESLGLTARPKKCEAMEGLLKEADELAEEFGDSHACDAALIAAAQKVEHYEIATYGSLLAFASKMGHAQAAKLLSVTLDEEKAADGKLTTISEAANSAADTPSSEE